jgi:hypothetical protein
MCLFPLGAGFTVPGYGEVVVSSWGVFSARAKRGCYPRISNRDRDIPYKLLGLDVGAIQAVLLLQLISTSSTDFEIFLRLSLTR